MKDRRERILDVAISLADEGGFENVRQREVAAKAGMALGTLYKSFRSKEDILSATLERESAAMERRLQESPAAGDTPVERSASLFAVITPMFLARPNYARAVLRAMASGVPEIAGNVVAYVGCMNRLIINALRGAERDPITAVAATGEETSLAFLLQEVWFASLVGWSAGLRVEAEIIEHLAVASELILRDYRPDD